MWELPVLFGALSVPFGSQGQNQKHRAEQTPGAGPVSGQTNLRQAGWLLLSQRISNDLEKRGGML